MKAYLLVTAVVFALLTIAHIWRLTLEPHLKNDAFFMFVTVLAAAACIWAFRLLRKVTQDGKR